MPNTQKKLLIVDDDPMLRTTLASIFSLSGLSVRTAEDGFTALGQIRKDKPDIVLSDLNMPGMSGFELLSVIRRKLPGLSVIAMSGAFSGDNIQQGVAADFFYEKAGKLHTLIQLVKAAGDEELPERPKGGTNSPIWILRNGNDADGVAYVIIACPECLRTFPQSLGHSTNLIEETACIHCHSRIEYAILQPTDAASPQAFQRKPMTIAVPSSRTTATNT